MSIHKSLVPASKLKRHRNVLTRGERLQILLKEDRWEEGKSVFGLPKVKNIKMKARAKAKKAEEAAPAEAAVSAATPTATTATAAKGTAVPPQKAATQPKESPKVEKKTEKK